MAVGARHENLAIRPCTRHEVAIGCSSRRGGKLLQSMRDSGSTRIIGQRRRRCLRQEIEAGVPRIVRGSDHALEQTVGCPHVARHTRSDRGVVGRSRWRGTEHRADLRVDVAERARLRDLCGATACILVRRAIASTAAAELTRASWLDQRSRPVSNSMLCPIVCAIAWTSKRSPRTTRCWMTSSLSKCSRMWVRTIASWV